MTILMSITMVLAAMPLDAFADDDPSHDVYWTLDGVNVKINVVIK